MDSDLHTSVFKALLKLWGYFSLRRRLQLAFLFLVMLSSGLAELLSLGAIMPFLAVLTNPEQLWQQPWIQPLVLGVGLSQSKQLVLHS